LRLMWWRAATQTKNEMESGLFLDVVVGECATVLELLASKNQSLLVGRDAFFVLNLALDGVDRIRGFNFERNSFSGEGLDENLHATPQTKNEVKGGFFLNIVIGERTTVFELLPSKNQSLLVWGDALLVLDLALDSIDRIRGFDL